MKADRIAAVLFAAAILVCALVAGAEPTPPAPTSTNAPAASSIPSIGSLPPAPDVSPTPNAYAVFISAMRAMRAAHALPTPAYLAYKLAIDTRNIRLTPVRSSAGSGFDATIDHADHHYLYQVWYRAKDGAGLSQDLMSHEAVSAALFAPAPADVEEEHSPKPVPSPVATSTANIASPPSLGTMSVAASRFYKISFQGLETVDGGPAIHLHLVAIKDAIDHPLTDLWIDPSTYLIRRASAAATFRAVAAGGGGQGDAIFGPVDKSWMVTAFDFTAKGYALVWHANVGMAVRAYDILPLASLPDAYFTTPSPKRSP